MVQTLRGSSLEERVTKLTALRAKAPLEAIKEFQEKLDMSWIYHDSALEGQVYNFEELRAAIDDQVVSDNSLIPVYDEIRQHKAAIDLVRELAEKKRLNLSLDVIKKIYTTLVPEEAEGKGAPKYRKDMPLHRLYFHEIAQPEKIGYQMRQLVQWVNAPETKRSTHTVRLAAKTHHKMLHTYPFPKHSGKVARLMMNLILLHHEYPPAIVHATERQRYYDALKTSPDAAAKLINEALGASVESTIRYFEDQVGVRA
ncbi:MAG: Fic family protein [Myxococcota bacterium]